MAKLVLGMNLSLNGYVDHQEFVPDPALFRHWIMSRSLRSAGPNAILIENDVEAVIRGLKARFEGEIAVSGPDLA